MKLMLRKTLLLTGALALLAGPALAQQGPQQNYAHGQPGQNPAQHESQQLPSFQNHNDQHGAPQSAPHETYNGGQHGDEHESYNGPPHGGWHDGDHYNGHRVVVQDWDHHHLHRPPPGYEWVQYGDQYMLIAVTSGIIASIIANSQAR